MAKILMVDDELDLEVLVRQKFRRQISDKTFQFLFAHNGVEALLMLSNDPEISLVVSDINMPEMDGLALLAEMQRQHPQVMAIIVSAYGDMTNIRTAMNLGAFDFVTKPINFDDLTLTIEKTLNHAEKLNEAEKNRMNLAGLLHELDVAATIQESILPKSFIADKSMEIFGTMEPARHIGGDFYDFFEVDDHKWGFVVADVSGKGIPAALFMTVSRTVLRSNAIGESSPSKVLTKVNNVLTLENDNMMFVTLFYGILDLQTSTLCYANGGHNPPYILEKSGKIVEVPSTKDIALGVVSDRVYREEKIHLNPGDLLLMYTDGVTEAVNMQKEQFGSERLIAHMATHIDLDPRELIQYIVREVKAFAGENAQSDDITLLAVRLK